MVYDSINDFTVNTSTIYISNVGSSHSITFKITRTVSNGLLENLVLISDFNGGYIAQLYQYDLTQEEIAQLENGGQIEDLKNKLTIVPLSNYNQGIFERNEVGVVQTYAIGDGRCGIFLGAEEVDGILLIFYLVVEGTCNGGANSPNGNYSPGEGGIPGAGYDWGYIFNDWNSNGGQSTGATFTNGTINLPNDPNDYFVTPSTPIVNLPQDDSHITDLNIISVNSVIKPKFFELSDEYNGTTEYGWEFRVNSRGEFVPVEAQVVYTSTGGAVQFPPVQANTLIRMHLHYNGLDPVFSEDDLIGMFSLFVERNQLNPTDSDKVTSILVTAGTTVYALRVDDPQKAQTFFDDIISDPVKLEKFEMQYEEYVVKRAFRDAIPNNLTSRENLLNKYLSFFLSDDFYETGLVLYKATLNLTNNTISAWEKVTY
ncbi:hypothetical protein H9X57_09345 [Flavobacterium piscinae]|nr:hypothetical protein [Flavobacterium piscinae]MBC8883524.1 hypothetical protein [Flavobacterium piscinae]